MFAASNSRDVSPEDPRDQSALVRRQPRRPSRAADALHLAVAALGGHALATLDARLAEGAQAQGVRVLALGD